MINSFSSQGRVDPQTSRPLSPANYSPEFKTNLSAIVAKLANHPSEPLKNAKTNMTEHPNPATAVFCEGATKSSHSSSPLKKLTIAFSGLQSHLTQIPSRVKTQGSRTYSQLKNAGTSLTTLFSKSTLNPTKSSDHPIHSSAKIAKEEHLKSLQQTQENTLKEMLNPKVEIDSLHREGLMSREEHKHLHALLDGKQYPESFATLNNWLTNEGGVKNEISNKAHPARELRANVLTFREKAPPERRLANDIESNRLPKKWEGELVSLLGNKNASSQQKIAELAMVRYLHQDFATEAHREQILSKETIEQVLAAPSYQEACQIATVGYKNYADEKALRLKPETHVLPGLRLRNLQATISSARWQGVTESVAILSNTLSSLTD